MFFVLPKASPLPQMIYGYFKVEDNVTHLEAYGKLKRKRMNKNKNPNGNIIVTGNGRYNRRGDNGTHKDRFEGIKENYVIGDRKDYEFLLDRNGRPTPKFSKLSDSFLPMLKKVFKTNKDSVYSIIGRKGRVLSEGQVKQLLVWLRK